MSAKIWSVVLVAAMCAVFTMGLAPAASASITFNFNGTGDLSTYMTGLFGSTVAVDQVVWDGQKIGTTQAQAALLDFDPALPNVSTFKITEVSYDWSFEHQTGNVSWGLDVFDDYINNWRLDVQTHGMSPTSGSDSLTFNSSWQVTALRFHDGGANDAYMDNLTVTCTGTPGQNPVDPVPEPATIIIWSLLGGLGVTVRWSRRRRAA